MSHPLPKKHFTGNGHTKDVILSFHSLGPIRNMCAGFIIDKAPSRTLPYPVMNSLNIAPLLEDDSVYLLSF